MCLGIKLRLYQQRQKTLQRGVCVSRFALLSWRKMLYHITFVTHCLAIDQSVTEMTFSNLCLSNRQLWETQRWISSLQKVFKYYVHRAPSKWTFQRHMKLFLFCSHAKYSLYLIDLTCPVDAPVMSSCNPNDCHPRNQICPAHPDAKCTINPCGGCSVEHSDENGTIVDCYG